MHGITPRIHTDPQTSIEGREREEGCRGREGKGGESREDGTGRGMGDKGKGKAGCCPKHAAVADQIQFTLKTALLTARRCVLSLRVMLTNYDVKR